MAMSKAEGWALGGAAAAHVLLFAALSFSLTQADPPPSPPPIAVEILAEAAPVATAPQISSEEPASALGEPELPPVTAPPEPEVAPPVERTAPPPPPKVEPDRARERQERERAAEAQRQRTERQRIERERQATAERERNERERRARTERERREREARAAREREQREERNRQGGDPLGDIASRVRQGQGRQPNPPATQTAAEIRADIRVSINAEVARPWGACRVTGIDVDRLRTTVVFRLAQSGALEQIVSVNTAGINESNRPQVQRFEECARRAITLAAPFTLPRENYQYWQTYTLDFEKR